MSKRWTWLTVVLLATVVYAACASQKAPAEAAVAAAEQAFTAAKAEATQYVPSEVTSVESALQAVKASLAKGDYQAALTGAQDLTAKVGALQAAATAKKAELTNAWTALSAGLPQVVQALQSRVDILSAAKKLPAGLDKAKLEGVKTGLAALGESWTAATASANAGDLAAAVAKATAVKGQAAELLTALGMPVPPALQ